MTYNFLMIFLLISNSLAILLTIALIVVFVLLVMSLIDKSKLKKREREK